MCMIKFSASHADKEENAVFTPMMDLYNLHICYSTLSPKLISSIYSLTLLRPHLAHCSNHKIRRATTLGKTHCLTNTIGLHP